MDKNKDSKSDKVIELLAKQLGKDAKLITPDKRIVEDLGADSLDVVEMLMMVEEKLGVTVPDEDAMGLKTVGDLIKYVDKNL